MNNLSNTTILIMNAMLIMAFTSACSGTRSPEYYQDNLQKHWDTFDAYNVYASSTFGGFGNFSSQRGFLCTTYEQWKGPLQDAYDFLVAFREDAPKEYAQSNAVTLIGYVDWGLRNMQSFDEDCP